MIVIGMVTRPSSLALLLTVGGCLPSLPNPVPAAGRTEPESSVHIRTEVPVVGAAVRLPLAYFLAVNPDRIGSDSPDDALWSRPDSLCAILDGRPLNADDKAFAEAMSKAGQMHFALVQVTPEGVWLDGRRALMLENGRFINGPLTDAMVRDLRARLSEVAWANLRAAYGCAGMGLSEPLEDCDCGYGYAGAALVAIHPAVPVSTLSQIRYWLQGAHFARVFMAVLPVGKWYTMEPEPLDDSRPMLRIRLDDDGAMVSATGGPSQRGSVEELPVLVKRAMGEYESPSCALVEADGALVGDLMVPAEAAIDQGATQVVLEGSGERPTAWQIPSTDSRHLPPLTFDTNVGVLPLGNLAYGPREAGSAPCSFDRLPHFPSSADTKGTHGAAPDSLGIGGLGFRQMGTASPYLEVSEGIRVKVLEGGLLVDGPRPLVTVAKTLGYSLSAIRSCFTPDGPAVQPVGTHTAQFFILADGSVSPSMSGADPGPTDQCIAGVLQAVGFSPVERMAPTEVQVELEWQRL